MKPTTQLPADENERIRLFLAKGADPRGLSAKAKRSHRDRAKSLHIPKGAHATRDGDAIRLVLPYPPSANSYWRHAKGVTYLSREAKDYRKVVALIGANCRPLRGPIRLTAYVYRPRRIGDLGNCEKVLSDALQGIAFEDDAQVVEQHLYRHDDKANPRAEVLVESLGPVNETLFDKGPKRKRGAA